MPDRKDAMPQAAIEQANQNLSQCCGVANYSFWWLFVLSGLVISGLYLPVWVLDTSCSDLLLGLPVCRETLLFGPNPKGMEPVLLLGWLGYFIAACDQVLERRFGVIAMKSFGPDMLRPAQIIATFFALVSLVSVIALLEGDEIPSLGVFAVILIGTLLAGLPMDNEAKRSDLTPLWARCGYVINRIMITLLTLSSVSALIEVAWLSSL